MEREAGLDLLASKGWLAAVPAEFRTALLSRAGWRKFEAGDQITLAGDEDGNLIGLAEGFVAFQVAFGQPTAPILHVAPPVFWMGYRPIVSDEARIATATARSTAWCATIPRRRVQALLQERPEWWRHVVALALEYGDAAATSGADLLIPDAETRLIAVLLRFAGLRGRTASDDEAVLVPITQQDLAGAANLSRNWTGTILRRLAAIGCLTPLYNGVLVQKPNELRRMLDLRDR